MAGTETLSQIARAAQVAAPIGQGFVNRDAGRTAAGVLRTQGRAALESAAYDEARARREGRQIIAQQEAAALAEGQGGSSSIDVIEQNRVNLIADALAVRARGQMDAAGYESRARVADYEADQAVFEGLATAGEKLLISPYERRRRALAVG